jgi:hypothetical protein
VSIESFGELLGLEGLSGTASREEPVAVRMTGAGQVVALFDELLDENGQRGGNWEQVIPDAESEPAVCGLEVGCPKSVDAADRQRVEQHEAARHPVDNGDVVVIEKARQQVESCWFGDGPWCARSVGRQLQWSSCAENAKGGDGVRTS